MDDLVPKNLQVALPGWVAPASGLPGMVPELAPPLLRGCSVQARPWEGGLLGWENLCKSHRNHGKIYAKTTDFMGKSRGNHGFDHQIIRVFQMFYAGCPISLGMEHW